MTCEVMGITYSEAEASLAAECLDAVLVQDLNRFSPAGIGRFDCAICSHVLEHLYDPRELLEGLHLCLEPDATLIVALPNALHWRQRLEFLRGRFRYTDGGLMDKTHYRFFDWATAEQLLRQSGFDVAYRSAHGRCPLPLLRRVMAPVATSLDKVAVQAMPGVFGTQFVLVGRKAAPGSWLLAPGGDVGQTASRLACHPTRSQEPGARSRSAATW